MNKTIEAKTYHKSECGRVFKHYDMTCSRCIELAGGAEARKGWYSRAADEFSDYGRRPQNAFGLDKEDIVTLREWGVI